MYHIIEDSILLLNIFSFYRKILYTLNLTGRYLDEPSKRF